MLVMIDNYDSFTYNLVQYLGELGQQVSVFRNDEISLDRLSALSPSFPCSGTTSCLNSSSVRLKLNC